MANTSSTCFAEGLGSRPSQSGLPVPEESAFSTLAKIGQGQSDRAKTNDTNHRHQRRHFWNRHRDIPNIVHLRPGKVAVSDEARSGLILDYDKAGRLVSMELLDASEQVTAPQSVEFALAGGD